MAHMHTLPELMLRSRYWREFKIFENPERKGNNG